MTDIPLERVGRIIDGPDNGRYVLVRNDQERAGGFLILQSSSPEMFSASGVFDDRVERHSDLDAFFAETGWTVDRRPGSGAVTQPPG